MGGEIGFEVFREIMYPIEKIPLGDYIISNWPTLISKARAIRRVKEVELPLAREVMTLCKKQMELTTELRKLEGYGDLDEREKDEFENLKERFTEIGKGKVEWRGKLMRNDIISQVSQNFIIQFLTKIWDKVTEPWKPAIYEKSDKMVRKVFVWLKLQDKITEKAMTDPNATSIILLQIFMNLIRGFMVVMFDKPSDETKSWSSKDLNESSILTELGDYKIRIQDSIDNLTTEIESLSLKEISEMTLLDNLTILPKQEIENMNERKLNHALIRVQNEILNARMQYSAHQLLMQGPS